MPCEHRCLFGACISALAKQREDMKGAKRAVKLKVSPMGLEVICYQTRSNLSSAFTRRRFSAVGSGGGGQASPSQVTNLCRRLQRTSGGRRPPRGVRLNVFFPGCRATKAPAEQRHFHHVSHSSWLTGTVKSSLVPPLCAGAHTHRVGSSCMPGWAATASTGALATVATHCRTAQPWEDQSFPSCSGHPSARPEGQVEPGEEMPQEEPVGAVPRRVLHPSYQSGFTNLLGVNTQQL